jgi:hypothetical protein
MFLYCHRGTPGVPCRQMQRRADVVGATMLSNNSNTTNSV